MAIRINTNISAMSAQRQLGATTANLSKSLERLGSGQRINRAADDAAGLAISETLKAQTIGMSQAIANSQDSINLIQTAEGGLAETGNILQRMRELSVQASNDTYTQDDRAKIQEEVGQLTQELSRIAGTTQFNGRNLLDGTIAQSSSATAGSANIKSNARVGSSGSYSDLVAAVSVTNSSTVSTDAALQFKVTASVTAGQYDLEMRASDGTVSVVSNIGSQAGNSLTFNLSSGAAVQVTMGAAAVATADIGDVATVQVTSAQAAVTVDNSLTFHVGANEGQVLKSGFSNMSAASLKLEGLSVLGTNDADSMAKAQNLIGVVDQAMRTVNTQRARMGAMQNRLEHTISNLQVAYENTSASRSRIADVDVAAESGNLTRQQILSQAATSILAQANAGSQNALALLR
jgi:flagellin